MTTEARTETTERFQVDAESLAEKVKELIHEGNVRRIIVKDSKDHTVLEVPVTLGVFGALMAPTITAVAALAAHSAQWTIEIERREQ